MSAPLVTLTPVSCRAARPAPTDPPLLVPELVVTVGEYLDGASALASVRVCKTWRDHLKDQAAHAKEDAYCRRVGYDPGLVQALRSRNLSLWRLPVLDLKAGVGDTFYIELSSKDMTSPLMRFTDKCRRVGLAFKLRGNADGNITLSVGGQEQEYSIREISTVLTVFQRYPNHTHWVSGSSAAFVSSIIEEFHRPYHPKNNSMMIRCPTCPAFLKEDMIGFGVAIITKSDPVLEIDGEIEQVAALLPPMPPKPVQEQRAPKNTPVSTSPRICSAVSRFFLWIASLFSRLVAYCRG